MAAHVGTLHQVKLSERSLLERTVENGAAAKHQDIQAAEIFLNLLADTADVFILGEIRRASVATRAKSVCLLRDVFKPLAAPRHKADFSAVPGQ